MLLRKAVAAIFALLMVAVGLAIPGHALAASANCVPEDGYSDCIYSPPMFFSRYGTPGFQPILVYAPNYSQTNYPMIDTAITNAINNWNVSGADVRLSRVSINSGVNVLQVLPATSMRGDTNFNCNSPWGQSWNGSQSDPYMGKVYLNQNIYSGAYGNCGQSVTTFTAIVTHEMGHAMGLAHNAYKLLGAIPGGPQYPLMKGSYQPKHVNDNTPVTIPTYVDVGLLNSLYPGPPVQCLSNPGDYYCDGQDPVVQGCGQLYTPVHIDVNEGWFEMRASKNCETNWAKASAWSGFRIYRISVERQTGSDGGALYTEDMPVSSQYYGNMIFAHVNLARVCVTFINVSTGGFSSRYCSGWY